MVEKGLLDTLLFGENMESALNRAWQYVAAVDQVLRPGGVLLQVSDAPFDMRRQLLEVLAPGHGSGPCTWAFAHYATGAAPLSILSARKPLV